MKAYQKRVVAEKKALDKKLESLKAFLGTKAFRLPAEQDRLERQSWAMTEYSAILGERIAAFKG